MNCNVLGVEAEDSFSSLLELAASNDLEGFKKHIERDPSSVEEVGLWYGRTKGSNQMVFNHRTPLMVAATYGSIDVLKLIVSLPQIDVNQSCGDDKITALHCAASSGSLNTIEIVKLLLANGADPNLADGSGCYPIDVIVVSPMFQDAEHSLQLMLKTDTKDAEEEKNLAIPNSTSSSDSPKGTQPNDATTSLISEKKEYPIDPSLPDIKNSIYSTDEFRMFSFKVRTCSRAYSHDWTECPFVHPGENARRRDPRKYHYGCVPCPDFRKGACRRGDMCEYAHGVFECWLHPAQYRTRLCKDGTNCNRRVCFFAHTQEELRPLYVSTGSTVPSPRSGSAAANAIDYAMNLLPGSPSLVTMMSPNPYTPPMSPSSSSSNTGISNWPPQQNVPALHLPSSHLQSSRLRSSSNAWDIPMEDLNLFPDINMSQHQILNEMPFLSQSSNNNNNANLLNRSTHSKILTPSNLEEIFSAEGSSPRYTEQHSLANAMMISPSHKSSVMNQFPQQQQSMLSPIKTGFSPRNVDQSLMQNHHHPFGVQSPGRMSPRNVEPISPMNARLSMFARQYTQSHQFQSLSSRDLSSSANSAVSSFEGNNNWSNFGNPNGPPDWAVGSSDNLGKMKRSSSFEVLNNGEEPDVSWVHLLVSPQEMKEKAAPRTVSGEGAGLDGDRIEPVDPSVLGAWLEQMKLDQLVAQ